MLLYFSTPSSFAASGSRALGYARFSRLTNGCALECGVGFRQLRTCRRTRPGQLCAIRRLVQRASAEHSNQRLRFLSYGGFSVTSNPWLNLLGLINGFQVTQAIHVAS